jgi:predicted metal-dependent HD superfamily phosphohydrolase
MVTKTAEAMISFYSGDIRRINHFLCVYGLAKTIGELEGLPPETQEILEIAALTHDIGIKVVEDELGACTATQQEKEGPPVAEKMLRELDCPENIVQRVSILIGRHHTYTNIDGPDCQILLEADFLVNIHGMGIDEKAVQSFKRKVFKTKSGLDLLNLMYGA